MSTETRDETSVSLTENPLVAETSFHVRYAETDQMGIVHHSAYIVWFEEGRSAWSRQMGCPYASFEDTGYALAVSEVHARYIAPARYDQRVTVQTRLSQARSRLVRFDYRVLDAETGDPFVTGYSTHVCLDDQGKLARIPEEWRRCWSKFVTEQ